MASKRGLTVHNAETRNEAAIAIGMIALAMRAEGMTQAAMSAGLPQRAMAEKPEAWAIVRGVHARSKPLGLTKTVALMRRALAHRNTLSREPVEHARAVLTEQADLLWRKLLSSDAFKRGDAKAIDAGRRLLADRARLHGLNVEKSGGELGALLSELVSARTREAAQAIGAGAGRRALPQAQAAHPFSADVVGAGEGHVVDVEAGRRALPQG